MIALAILGLALPPWSAIGPASRASALESRLLCRAIPGLVVTAFSTVVDLASGHRDSSWNSLVASFKTEPLDASGDADLKLADRDGDQGDGPGDVDDLASPLVVQSARSEHGKQARIDCGCLEARTDRPSPDQALWAIVRLCNQASSADDLPTSLCRLTC